MIRRRLLIKLKDGLRPEQVEDWKVKLYRMPKEIPGIVSWHLARNESWDGQFDYIWETSYKTAADLDVYTNHPFHDQVVRPLFPTPPNTHDDGSKPTCIVARIALVHYTSED
jgi:stress responsive alpha/beta barrel protein